MKEPSNIRKIALLRDPQEDHLRVTEGLIALPTRSVAMSERGRD
jgi:hypothetical protein